MTSVFNPIWAAATAKFDAIIDLPSPCIGLTKPSVFSSPLRMSGSNSVRPMRNGSNSCDASAASNPFTPRRTDGIVATRPRIGRPIDSSNSFALRNRASRTSLAAANPTPPSSPRINPPRADSGIEGHTFLPNRGVSSSS